MVHLASFKNGIVCVIRTLLYSVSRSAESGSKKAISPLPFQPEIHRVVLKAIGRSRHLHSAFLTKETWETEGHITSFKIGIVCVIRIVFAEAPGAGAIASYFQPEGHGVGLAEVGEISGQLPPTFSTRGVREQRALCNL